MSHLGTLRRLFEHDAWGNHQALESLAGSSQPPVQALKALAHVLGAERLWLDRLLGGNPAIAVWPELAPDRLREGFEDMARRWTDYLDDLEPGDLDCTIDYVNSKGESWTNTVGDVLLHVVLHSSYHRGQVASHVRASGSEPAYTDFIHAIRTGQVE